MQLSGLGMELIHYLSRQFDLPVRVAFWRSISMYKGLSTKKDNSFPTVAINLKTCRQKIVGLNPLSTVWIVLIDLHCI